MTRHQKAICRYLEALGKLCAEVAAEPRLLPTFLQVLALVPRTIAELVAELALRVKKQSAHPQIPSDHPKGTHQSGSNTQSPLPRGIGASHYHGPTQYWRSRRCV